MPGSKYIQAHISEGWADGHAVFRKVGHFLMLCGSSESPTCNTKVNDLVHTPFATEDPESCSPDSALCEMTSLGVDAFMVVPDQ